MDTATLPRPRPVSRLAALTAPLRQRWQALAPRDTPPMPTPTHVDRVEPGPIRTRPAGRDRARHPQRPQPSSQPPLSNTAGEQE